MVKLDLTCGRSHDLVLLPISFTSQKCGMFNGKLALKADLARRILYDTCLDQYESRMRYEGLTLTASDVRIKGSAF